MNDLARIPGIDPTVPNAARVYDYWLGGRNNFAADREMAHAITAAVPESQDACLANRAFVRRVVRFLTSAGIRQMIDIGSGLPTQGNVHEIAQQIVSAARVVYVDYDPIVLAHSRALLVGSPSAAAIEADVRRPAEILANPALRELIDLRQPAAVLLTAVLQFVSDAEDPYYCVAYLRDNLALGSYVAISHGSDEGMSAASSRLVYEAYRHSSATRIVGRSRAEVTRLLGGLEILPPGVVWVPAWRPDPGEEVRDPQRSHFLGGVGKLVKFQQPAACAGHRGG